MKESVIEEFRRRRIRYWLRAWLWLFVQLRIGVLLLTGRPSLHVVLLVFFGAVVLFWCFHWRDWRCPSCDKFLGVAWGSLRLKWGIRPSFCPRCKVQLV